MKSKRTKTARMPGEIWRPGERKIYCFHDGVKERKVDPLAAMRRMLSVPDFDLQYELKILGTTNEKEIAQSIDRLADAASQALTVQRFNETTGEGMLDMDLVALLLDFSAFVLEVKKNMPSEPTWPNSMAVPSSEPSTTKPILASGSTAAAV